MNDGQDRAHALGWGTAEQRFVSLYQKSYPEAVSVFETGIDDALIYLRYPGSHHVRLRTTNMLERLFKEVKRRTRVVGVPQRGECEHAGHRDSIEEHRAVGTEALPHDGRARSNRKAQPTTFETLTYCVPGGIRLVSIDHRTISDEWCL